MTHRHLLKLGGFGDSSAEFLDKHPSPSFQKIKPAKLIYVDNELFVCSSDSEAKQTQENIKTYMFQGLEPSPPPGCTPWGWWLDGWLAEKVAG